MGFSFDLGMLWDGFQDTRGLWTEKAGATLGHTMHEDIMNLWQGQNKRIPDSDAEVEECVLAEPCDVSQNWGRWTSFIVCQDATLLEFRLIKTSRLICKATVGLYIWYMILLMPLKHYQIITWSSNISQLEALSCLVSGINGLVRVRLILTFLGIFSFLLVCLQSSVVASSSSSSETCPLV